MGYFWDFYLSMICCKRVTSTEGLGAIDSAFIGSEGVCKSVINYTKIGEKHTSQRMMQIRNLSKNSMFIQYKLVVSTPCVRALEGDESGGIEAHRPHAG